MTAAEPAEEILCEECPEGCWIKPTIGKDPKTHRRVGTYFCRRNDDIGWFKVDLARRRRWKFSLAGLAKAVSKAVKPTGKVTELAPERLAMLGTVKLDGKVQELFLARGAAWLDAAQVFGNCSRLKMASHPAVLTLAAMPKERLLASCDLAVRPLVEIADFDGKVLHIPLQGALPEVPPGPWVEVVGISPPAARNGKPSAVGETAMLPPGKAGGYDPDAYMPVKEVRESADPPWDFAKWTKIKAANPWLRFDPKAKKQRPRLHRADAARLKTGQFNPDTFELIDKGDHKSLEKLTDEYLADAAARKAEIDAQKRRSSS